MKILSETPSAKGYYRIQKGNSINSYKKVYCECCNEPCYKTSASLKKYTHHFCSSKCIAKYRFNLDEEVNPLKYIEDNNFYYLLGLIITDGHIAWPKCTPTQTYYVCNITLHKNDIQLLYDIQKKFGGNITNSGNCCIWNTHCKEFVDYLRFAVGLTNNKSLTLNIDLWYNTLTPRQKHYFWRGCIDGDGYVNNTDISNFVALYTASPHFADLIKREFKIIGWEVKQKTSTMYCFRLAGNRNNLKDFRENIFSFHEGDLFMQRKFDKFCDIFKKI